MASARGQITVGDNTAVDPSTYTSNIPVINYGSFPLTGLEGSGPGTPGYVSPQFQGQGYAGTIYANPLGAATLSDMQAAGYSSPYLPPPTGGGSNPNPIQPPGPLDEITTLLDLFHNQFAPASALPISPAAAPGVTVIPGSTDSGSGATSSTTVIVLAVLGIAVTIGAHWYFEKHKK